MAAPTASRRRLRLSWAFLAALLAAGYGYAAGLTDTIFTVVESDLIPISELGFNDGDEPIEPGSQSGPILATRSR